MKLGAKLGETGFLEGVSLQEQGYQRCCNGQKQVVGRVAKSICSRTTSPVSCLRLWVGIVVQVCLVYTQLGFLKNSVEAASEGYC